MANIIYLPEVSIIALQYPDIFKDNRMKYNNLVNFFDSCLEEVRNYYNYDCENINKNVVID